MKILKILTDFQVVPGKSKYLHFKKIDEKLKDEIEKYSDLK